MDVLNLISYPQFFIIHECSSKNKHFASFIILFNFYYFENVSLSFIIDNQEWLSRRGVGGERMAFNMIHTIFETILQILKEIVSH